MSAFFTIVPNSSAVDIVTANSSLSYQQIVNTLFQTSYKLKTLDIEASSFSQLTEPYSYNKYDADGNVKTDPLVPIIDQYQYLSTLVNIPVQDDFVIDSMTTISFNLEPFASVQFLFYTLSVRPSNIFGQEQNFGSEIEEVSSFIKKSKNGDGLKVVGLVALAGVGIFALVKLLKAK